LAIGLLAAAIVWFGLSVTAETRRGIVEAERSFNWISRECSAIAVSDGFMSDSFIQKITAMCNQSKLISAVALTTPSGTAFAWPDRSPQIRYDMRGNPTLANSSLFVKVYAKKIDLDGMGDGSFVMTAAVYVLHPDAIFAASRNSFLAILTILFTTLVVLLVTSSAGHRKNRPSPLASFPSVHQEADRSSAETGLRSFDGLEEEFLPPEIPVCESSGEGSDLSEENATEFAFQDSLPVEEGSNAEQNVAKPEGLFSPVTGIGWQQYLSERLDSELVRAASSEQDLSLIVIRISGLLHTDLLSRKVAQVLLDTFKFKDMVFEFGDNGFAGILQNVNLDQAMKIADVLYAGIDSLLMEMSHEGQITVGITTRTARLLPASRMIEEALSAARKAEEEPSLPIVAFRANPEKYRDFVAEKS
jgi:GGDEF domain-containing protein